MRITFFVAFLLILIFSGCTHKEKVRVAKYEPVSLEKKDKVVVLLDKYAIGDEPVSNIEEYETYFDSCVQEHMKKSGFANEFLPADSYRMLFEKTKSRSVDLNSPIDHKILSDNQIHYGVLLDVHTKKVTQGTTFDGEWPLIWFVSVDRRKLTWIKATIVNYQNLETIGKLDTNAHGSEMGGAIVIIILPIPLFKWADTEGVACEAMAQALSEFFVNDDQGLDTREYIIHF